MKFNVKEACGCDKSAQYEVVTECGKRVDGFASREHAQAKADWLTTEYERVLEIL